MFEEVPKPSATSLDNHRCIQVEVVSVQRYRLDEYIDTLRVSYTTMHVGHNEGRKTLDRQSHQGGKNGQWEVVAVRVRNG